MPEWSIGTVLKTVVGESLPWVRIPPPPFLPRCPGTGRICMRVALSLAASDLEDHVE